MTAAQQRHYDECLANGCSPGLAEMFALQAPPMSNSDREFLHDTHETGKKYISQIARFPNDPRALVSSRGEVQKICEQNGWGCEGAVTTKVNDLGREPPAEVGLAEHLVEKYATEAVAKHPELALKPAEEVREMVKERHTPHWAKKKIPRKKRN